ncbi:hypothetical protein QJS10_CPA07g00380 [Acorus calamus]|uniref:YLP motif-containing protein 1 n=1 Tax=Acorus calamus TaxID=4465 RepID=A0AAV9EKF1_ACOCL|nr:hypothetical protein QJS10_CPA07g00380 [Acorus calamus]
MDDSWRIRPIHGTNICPTCYTSHYPFCPPPPLPPFDPHLPPHPPPPMPPPHPPLSSHHRPYYVPPTPWTVDRTAERPPPPPPFPYHHHPPSGFFHDRDPIERDGFNKRMRVASVEDERRLSLIRDFGGEMRSDGGNPYWQAPPLQGFQEQRRIQSDPLEPNGWYGMRPVEVKPPAPPLPPPPPPPPPEDTQKPVEVPLFPVIERSDAVNVNNQRGYSMPSEVHPSQMHNGPSLLPPLPTKPPMVAPHESPMSHLHPRVMPSVSRPIQHGGTQAFSGARPHMYGSSGEAGIFVQQLQPKPLDDGQHFRSSAQLTSKSVAIDAARLFRHPHRATRPDHLVIILRGLPGSGKSYLAKTLRDLEVDSGGNAPRIHSMDDYFMTEIEKKVEESEGSRSSGSIKGKRQITKKVLEYCYEPEMEEAYRTSMLRAFKKTLDEGIFTFIIVDDRNLRVADFAQFWATAKRSGYEVYLLEAAYKDPTGCAARNVHGFTLDDIQKMADQWEEAPSLYLQLDAQSLFHGDNLKEHSIQEVDMDTEDETSDAGIYGFQDTKNLPVTKMGNYSPDGSSKAVERWDTVGEYMAEVKELASSKWSKDVNEDIEKTEDARGQVNALSGLIQAYGKRQKSVHWGDQVKRSGFSIGAARKTNFSSLIIGPGCGYNLDSNPLSEEETTAAIERTVTDRSVFLEHRRAERESFRAVFDRRRQRIAGLDAEDE